MKVKRSAKDKGVSDLMKLWCIENKHRTNRNKYAKQSVSMHVQNYLLYYLYKQKTSLENIKIQTKL